MYSMIFIEYYMIFIVCYLYYYPRCYAGRGFNKHQEAHSTRVVTNVRQFYGPETRGRYLGEPVPMTVSR